MGIARIFKLAFISAIVLFVITTAISLLLPSTINVSRAIDINTEPDSAKVYIANLSKWSGWLATNDSSDFNIKMVEGKETLVLNNTKIQVGNVTDSLIQTTWKVGNNKPMPGNFRIIVHNESNIITVQWAFVLKVKWYPWQKFSSIISDRALGSFMEPSLEKLKNRLEN